MARKQKKPILNSHGPLLSAMSRYTRLYSKYIWVHVKGRICRQNVLLDVPIRNQRTSIYNTWDAPGPVLLPKAPNVITNLFWKYMSRINIPGASLVAQWLRICLPIQGTRVRALVWEDPTCCGATRSVSHNYWACASGACALQQERQRQWEARARDEEWPPLATTRESPCTETKTQHSQK